MTHEYVYVCMICLDNGTGAFLSPDDLTDCFKCGSKVVKIGFVNTMGGDPLEG